MGNNKEVAQSPQGVFVLNFENWDLGIVWYLGFEYCNSYSWSVLSKTEHIAKIGNRTF